MSSLLEIPWHKYALISKLSGILQEVSPQFGRTALQKMVYILQEVFSVPLGYRFVLHNYGPYSKGLAVDLEASRAVGAVSIGVVLYGNYYGYQIEQGPRAEAIQQKGYEFLAAHERHISQVVEQFGQFSAKDLELYSTALYVARDLRTKAGYATMAEVVRIVGEVKPAFSAEEIGAAVTLLKQLDFVQIDERT